MYIEEMASLIQKISEALLEPFATPERLAHALSNAVRSYTIDWQSKTALPYMLSSIIIAWLIYRLDRRSGRIGATTFASFLCPRQIYLHRSAIVDYKYVAFDLSIKLLLYTPLISGVSWVLYKSMRAVISTVAVEAPLSGPLTIGYIPGLIAFMLGDFGFFLSHYLMHKVPLLWHFHEVHHSAEVLTPVTVHRVHPVEDLVNALVGACIGAIGATVYSSSSSEEVGMMTFLGVNILLVFYFAFAFQLRHSHVWLSYGKWLSRILVSPAQHQIHHSVDPKHWDKNFGFTFAIWDWAFGSLYVPKSKETLRFGLSYANPQDFSTVSQLYFMPFVKAMRPRMVGQMPPASLNPNDNSQRIS